MQKVNNKVRLGLYLDPVMAARFEMYRKTLFGIEISQSAFFRHVFEKFEKEMKK